MKEDRSRIVSITSDTLVCMAKNLKNNFEPIASTVFRECFDRIASGYSV